MNNNLLCIYIYIYQLIFPSTSNIKIKLGNHNKEVVEISE